MQELIGVRIRLADSHLRAFLRYSETYPIRLMRALANLALGAQVIGPLALTLIGLFFCQSRAEVIIDLG